MRTTITPLIRHEWEDVAVFDEEAFLQGVHDLGLGVEEDSYRASYRHATKILHIPITIGAKFKDPDGYAHAYHKQLKGRIDIAKDRLKDILGILDVRVEDTIQKRVDVPLFRLHSPKVNGSCVTYQESNEAVGIGDWWVTIFGSGMGAKQDFMVKYSSSFKARNGECKEIFAPITLQISYVSVYKAGARVGQGLRAEALPMDGKKVINKGVAIRPESYCCGEDDADSDHEEEIFPLAAEGSNSIPVYERIWTRKEAISTQLGIEAFSVKSTLKTEVRHTRDLKLVFELPGGYDYRLRRLKKAHGFSWYV
ncbi:MAG TPA: hypothetical protein VN493_27960 [Thermoanaerobaculia bacterium]|nr:hypothetical protein [Thermoanaerobaculia bacterium]